MTYPLKNLWHDPTMAVLSPLVGELDCDIVVVGAGYTGLSAAIALAEQGADVVVVEREYTGFGASGRNAGHLTPTIGKDLPSLLRVYGRETGGALVRLAEKAVEHTEATIIEREIACDYVPHGNVVAGIHPGQEPKLRAAASAGAALGADLRVLSSGELTERGIPSFVACGYLEARGGVLHPGKYVRGLRDVALAKGVRLFEQTAVTHVTDSPRLVQVHTPHGRVSAGRCVLATTAYSPELGFLRRRVAPITVSLLSTQPLTEEQRARVDWRGGEGIYTAHESLENYRTTPDGRILGGSRYVRSGFGHRLSPDHAPRVVAKLEGHFRERFPELHDVRIEQYWSGAVAMSLNFLPWIGFIGDHARIVASLGCVGHGVAMSSHLGTVAADVVLHNSRGPAVLAERRNVPIPPEPLRWLGVRAVSSGLNLVDRRSDQKAAARR